MDSSGHGEQAPEHNFGLGDCKSQRCSHLVPPCQEAMGKDRTMCRTMRYKKPLPSTSTRMRWDAGSVTVILLIVLTGSTSSGKVLAKCVKSCLPTNSCAASLHYAKTSQLKDACCCINVAKVVWLQRWQLLQSAGANISGSTMGSTVR